MIRILLKGRLGNHLFQVAAGIALSERLKVPAVLDFALTAYSPFDYLKAPIMQFRHGLSVTSIFVNQATRAFTFRNTYEWFPWRLGYTGPDHAYDPDFERCGPNTILSGYYQNELYFKPASDSIRSRFLLNHLESVIPSSLLESLRASNSVAVHVRRGDYLDPVYARLAVCKQDYYDRAMNLFRKAGKDYNFFFFSDDPAWCENIFRTNDCTTVLLTKTDKNPSIMDFYMISQCRNQIISNSSFSWWSAWLNSNPHKIVIAPDHWSTDDHIAIDTKRFDRFFRISEISSKIIADANNFIN